MLDANADGADWREVSWIVLHVDVERSLIGRGARMTVILAHAKWMTGSGYKQLQRRDWWDDDGSDD
jgi:hypothetical protein